MSFIAACTALGLPNIIKRTGSVCVRDFWVGGTVGASAPIGKRVNIGSFWVPCVVGLKETQNSRRLSRPKTNAKVAARGYAYP